MSIRIQCLWCAREWERWEANSNANTFFAFIFHFNIFSSKKRNKHKLRSLSFLYLFVLAIQSKASNKFIIVVTTTNFISQPSNKRHLQIYQGDYQINLKLIRKCAITRSSRERPEKTYSIFFVFGEANDKIERDRERLKWNITGVYVVTEAMYT